MPRIFYSSYIFCFGWCIPKVAFLASAVGPRVAASCAHAALAVLSVDNSGSTSQVEAPGHDNRWVCLS